MPVEEKSLQDLVAEKLGKKESSNMRDDSGTTKYLIHAKIEANGVVERPDVVGAIFGQTEGLLGNDLDLRELLKSGRIGRIKVEINSSQGKSTGTITIPSSLDKVETAIIAASLETIDRVGPCEATIKVERIEDVRDIKRKFVVERAKELLGAFEEVATETQEITEKVMESVRVEEISEYEGLPAGPGVKDSDAIIIVEGRADVLNLLRAGIRNAIAIEGTSVPKAVIELTKDKTVTAFVDSDRGGDLILKELLQVAEIDFVARPPPGRSVEELSKKEIIKALRNKVPVEFAAAEYRAKPAVAQPAETGNSELHGLENMTNKLRGTLKAQLLNEKLELIEEIQVRELKERLSQAQNVKAVIFDGVITQELAELAAEKGVQYIVGMRSRVESVPPNLRVLTLDDLRRSKHQR
ncbi:MAG: DNA primase DnaG [Candidatus Hadarchaeum sp.]|uniref:DNA primase DnaG n=1 Tax=Candidatus Hadarchaeum sp. TaxID=2883567 RepID=UPI003D10BF7A